ncbi:MAG TPA: enoyl-CoA hydratase/isomerase family protein [Bacteroidetes bacterium]|nr:enoyl-CoA hydratase/isomerase family protein [Bacteroidota bacterium]
MKGTYQFIRTETGNRTGTLWLNRPQVRNAFHEGMITEIMQGIRDLTADPSVRVILLRGEGKAFCAGADLNWMRNVAGYSWEQNYRESLQLAECFHTLYSCPKPAIAVVNGASIGGANGLVAACDMAYASDEAVFSLSEVKLGLVPAVISPFVIRRTGEYTARELMLTGRRFTGKEAEHYRLVNRSLPEAELEKNLEEMVALLLAAGPQALTRCKLLINGVTNQWSLKDALAETARMIASVRISAEGQEGMRAFLEKRDPSWINRE